MYGRLSVLGWEIEERKAEGHGSEADAGSRIAFLFSGTVCDNGS
jgi:hypothetical protein